MNTEVETASGWAEFNAAAAWCAERGGSTTILPVGLSPRARNLINKYKNVFSDRVWEFTAARMVVR